MQWKEGRGAGGLRRRKKVKCAKKNMERLEYEQAKCDQSGRRKLRCTEKGGKETR